MIKRVREQQFRYLDSCFLTSHPDDTSGGLHFHRKFQMELDEKYVFVVLIVSPCLARLLT